VECICILPASLAQKYTFYRGLAPNAHQERADTDSSKYDSGHFRKYQHAEVLHSFAGAPVVITKGGR
jgi:hypothetical protein